MEHRDAVRELTEWKPPDAEQAALRAQYLEFLDAHRDALQRQCRTGHLTASAMVTNPERSAVLLTLHARVGRWLQLGGHIEPLDQSLQWAAAREAAEESGHQVLTISKQPVRLDLHPVRCGASWSVHLDVQFVATLPGDTMPNRSAESHDLAWFPIDAAPGDASVQALVAAVRGAHDTQVTLL